jgi:hypothetical protein
MSVLPVVSSAPFDGGGTYDACRSAAAEVVLPARVATTRDPAAAHGRRDRVVSF